MNHDRDSDIVLQCLRGINTDVNTNFGWYHDTIVPVQHLLTGAIFILHKVFIAFMNKIILNRSDIKPVKAGVHFELTFAVISCNTTFDSYKLLKGCLHDEL